MLELIIIITLYIIIKVAEMADEGLCDDEHGVGSDPA